LFLHHITAIYNIILNIIIIYYISLFRWCWFSSRWVLNNVSYRFKHMLHTSLGWDSFILSTERIFDVCDAAFPESESGSNTIWIVHVLIHQPFMNSFIFWGIKSKIVELTSFWINSSMFNSRYRSFFRLVHCQYHTWFNSK